jgi:hypothetical protein
MTRIPGEQLRHRPCVIYNSDVYIELADQAIKAIRYPCLIAEVLSPGIKARDRGIKADLYQNIPKGQEILLIETQVMRVQRYRRETNYWTRHTFEQWRAPTKEGRRRQPGRPPLRIVCAGPASSDSASFHLWRQKRGLRLLLASNHDSATCRRSAPGSVQG